MYTFQLKNKNPVQKEILTVTLYMGRIKIPQPSRSRVSFYRVSSHQLTQNSVLLTRHSVKS